MSHVRQQIRDRVVAILSSNTTAGARVYTGRVFPFDALPAISVDTPVSSLDERLSSQIAQGIAVDLEIELRDESRASVVDALDSLDEVVHGLVMADASLGIGAFNIQWQSHITELDERKVPTGVQRVTYLVLVKVARNDHSTIL